MYLSPAQWSAIRKLAAEKARNVVTQEYFPDTQPMVEAGFDAPQIDEILSISGSTAHKQMKQVDFQVLCQAAKRTPNLPHPIAMSVTDAKGAAHLLLDAAGVADTLPGIHKAEAVELEIKGIRFRIERPRRLGDYKSVKSPEGEMFYWFNGEFRRSSAMAGFGIK